MSFRHAPRVTINRKHHYTAVLKTSDGTITIGLLPKVAPLAVNNFVFLARHHFYDHVIFHRIKKGFVAQSGDPTGTGFGGPGYTDRNEPAASNYTPGTVAMANTGQPNSNGSQFFIVTGSEALHLPHTFTIFGQVSKGTRVVQMLDDTPVQPNPGTNELSQPIDPPVIRQVTIYESS